MFPLRSTESVRKFPKFTSLVICFWILCEIFLRFSPTRNSLLEQFAFIPSQLADSKKFLSGWCYFLFHGNLMLLFSNLLFLWAFTPRYFERRGFWVPLILGIASIVISRVLFSYIHPQAQSPILAPEVLLGVWLGAAMRRDIWGSVQTLVIGWGWVRILEVPSYVLLFFWFFYLMLGNLFLTPPFSDSPMLYFLSLFSFLFGFVVESFIPSLPND